MWYCPEKYKTSLPNLNEEYRQIEGEITDRQAKITLAKFLRQNLGFTTELLSGIKLAPFQEITLKAFFNRNFNMCVWGRGCGACCWLVVAAGCRLSALLLVVGRW